jgi:hypothetical protein
MESVGSEDYFDCWAAASQIPVNLVGVCESAPTVVSLAFHTKSSSHINSMMASRGGRATSGPWNRLKPANFDPLEAIGLPSKGDTRYYLFKSFIVFILNTETGFSITKPKNVTTLG